jgi:hypothetical protein
VLIQLLMEWHWRTCLCVALYSVVTNRSSSVNAEGFVQGCCQGVELF